MGSRRVEARQFRETSKILPEERKATIEHQIQLIEALRDSILEALREGAGITQSLQKGIRHSLRGEGRRLLDGLGKIDDPDPSSRESQGANLIDEKLAALQGQLEALGGSTREQTVRVLGELDLEHYWFGDAFDRFEQRLFEELLVTRCDIPPENQTTLDIGIGAARASKLALGAVQQQRGPDIRERFAGNLHGLDLMPRFVEMSREALTPYGVPLDNIVQGDFLNFPHEFLKGQFDCAWAGMHTLWHCTTESELRQFFRNIEKALKKGGRLFFDTVSVYHHQGIPKTRRVAGLHDLYDFYGVLIRRYRQDHIDPERRAMKPLLQLERFPIHDNTAGVDFYTREVLAKEYIDYVLGKMKSGLRRERGPSELTNNAFDPAQSEKLGLQWIEENGLRDWLRREIAYRVSQIQSDPNGYQFLSTLLDPDNPGQKPELSIDIRPLYALPKAKRDALPLALDIWEVDAALRKVATRMVHDYVQLYYTYRLTG